MLAKPGDDPRMTKPDLVQQLRLVAVQQLDFSLSESNDQEVHCEIHRVPLVRCSIRYRRQTESVDHGKSGRKAFS